MQAFFIRWILTTASVLVAAQVVDGITYTSWYALLAASLVLGIINAVFKPLLMLLSLPLLFVTFGLFTFVINGFLFFLVGKIVHGFNIASWGSAFWGSLVISIVSLFLKGSSSRTKTTTIPTQNQRPSRSNNNKDKVIDV